MCAYRRAIVTVLATAGAWAFEGTLRAQDRQMGGVGLTVYTDPNYRGRNATFRNDVPNLQSYSGFNDRISSLQVGPGETWEVCEHANYEGRCQVVSETEPDLRRRGWNDTISSVRRIRGGYPGYPGRPPVYPPVQPGPRGLELYSSTGFRGDRRVVAGAVADFRSLDFNDRAMSLRVPPGQVWEICTEAYFQNCRQVNTDWSSLSGFRGMSRSISSARPWQQGGGGYYPPPQNDVRLVLYDDRGFRGRSYTVSAVTPVLSGFMNRAESLQVFGGVWELCERPRFGGRCVNVSSSVPDLRSLGLRNRVGSARPAIMPR